LKNSDIAGFSPRNISEVEDKCGHCQNGSGALHKKIFGKQNFIGL
jgi:hypothetical protein